MGGMHQLIKRGAGYHLVLGRACQDSVQWVVIILIKLYPSYISGVSPVKLWGINSTKWEVREQVGTPGIPSLDDIFDTWKRLGTSWKMNRLGGAIGMKGLVGSNIKIIRMWVSSAIPKHARIACGISWLVRNVRYVRDSQMFPNFEEATLISFGGFQ